MKLEVRINAGKMNKYIREGGELLFDIAWVDNGLYYPMDPWLDFGVLILGWWTNAILSIIKGEEDNIKLSFMDGPYYLMMTIDRTSQEVTFSGENGREFKAKSSIDEVRNQVISAAKFIDEELSKHHLLTTDRESLAWCIKSLSQSTNLPKK
jgi:hypothetical protein